MPPPHFRIRICKFSPRSVLRVRVRVRVLLVFSLFVFASVFVFHRPHYSIRGDNVIPHVGAFRFVDELLDEAIHVSLSNTQSYVHQDGRSRPRPRGADAHAHPPRASTYQLPLVNSTLQVDLDTLRAQACHILRGKSVLLVGPHETLYQLHSYLLVALHPDANADANANPIPGITIAPTMRPSCPGATLSYSCPSHPLCHPTKLPPQSSFHSGSDINDYDHESPSTLADTPSTNSSSSGSLLRFLNSGNLNPSTTRQGEDVRLSSVPSVHVDPRTGTRVVDSRWVRYAASSKADIIVLNRGPLPAPAWSYNNNNNVSLARNLNLTWWLTTLRALEQKHCRVEPLSDLFAGILSRLDDDDDDDSHPPAEPEPGTDPTKKKLLVVKAALHSTISTFLPSLLSTLSKLRENAAAGHHRPILGSKKKTVLWYGSWFLPVSCAPDSLSVFFSSSNSEGDDPRYLLAQLLAQAEAMNDPWSAYYNAQGSYDFNKNNGVHCPFPFLLVGAYGNLVASVYMHDRLLARLLPIYGIFYISSLSTIAPLPDVGQTYHQGE